MKNTVAMNNNDNALITSVEAEKYLQFSLGEPDGYWRVFLQNNRRPDRQPPHFIPFLVTRGRPNYRVADLDKYIATYRAGELARGKLPGRLAEAMREIGGWPTGRPFKACITPQVEEATGITFISLHVADPLAIYRLEPEQARSLAAELIEAADVADRAAGSAS